MTALRTDRLDLAPLSAEDAPRVQALLNHPEVGRYLLDGRAVSRAWVEEEIDTSRRRFETGSCGLWLADLRHPGAGEKGGLGSTPATGLVGFRPFFDPPELQLLYAFDPGVWGRGLATEAARAACDFAFRELGFEEVVAATDEPNAASASVLARLGMELWKTEEGAPYRTLFFRVGRETWTELRAGGEPR